MIDDRTAREQIARLLEWSDAHANFQSAVADLPPALRGVRPTGLPHSPWELLEHIRITQRDILDFCLAEEYRELEWPSEYWPAAPSPETDADWDSSVAAVQRDREELQRIGRSELISLHSPVPNGAGQTFLRELLLAADHTAYHVGQLVLVRRLLGGWPVSR